MKSSFCLCFAGWLFLSSLRASAHRDYEAFAGTFHRKDGVSISIVECYTDGILRGDPVSIAFRTPDQTTLAQTGHDTDMILRVLDDRVEVYEYGGWGWIPVAGKIYRFNGFNLQDTTSGGGQVFSIWIHLLKRWPVYGVLLAGAVLLRYGSLFIGRIPSAGAFALFRWMGILASVALGLVFVLATLMSPISPPVLLILGGMVFLAARHLPSRRA
ncbi:MAG TPA: hypothetical protein VMF06_14840 [Candidatus Limnocylindria bacterium]|nr:hypothetical protein [Candidatus Limnocylindria bacterium]